MPGGATGVRARRCYTISLFVSQASRSPSVQQSDVGRRTRTFTVRNGTALGRNGLRNWFECTITFGCAVNEVTRNMRTCICPQWRLIRSKKQQVTLVWRMTQISKLKLAANAPAIVPRLVEVGTGIPLNSESPSHGLTFNPQLSDSGRCQWAPAPPAGRQGLSGTVVRDQGSGASSWMGPGRGQSLVPGPSQKYYHYYHGTTSSARPTSH